MKKVKEKILRFELDGPEMNPLYLLKKLDELPDDPEELKKIQAEADKKLEELRKNRSKLT